MLILLANTDGPPRRLNAIRIVNLQPLTRPRRARLAGAGAARSSARLRVHDENDVRVWVRVETSLFSPE